MELLGLIGIFAIAWGIFRLFWGLLGCLWGLLMSLMFIGAGIFLLIVSLGFIF